MELSYEKIKEIFEKYGYFAEDELIWQTYINVDKIINNGQVGQDIHAICLEGPPGAGKTEYAKVYTKLLAELLGEEVSLIDYQCDSTTGKADLYEEIRVSAAIVGNPDEVIIAGKLVEAIDEVNSGKKVILFLDEYDKAREETDVFLLKFLQEGRINTTQRGDVEISPENMQNLQCILCKNQMREELSGPLERRVKILRLAEMKPEVFYKVAQRQLPNEDTDVLNVVSILYGALYDNKDDFARIPSCSENLMAIKDACTLLRANAPEEFVYSAIISNMLKNPDDIETFRHLLSKDERLAEFFKKSCAIRDEISSTTPAEEMRRRMLADFFADDISRVSEDIKRANRLLTEAHIENDYLEERIQERNEEIAKRDEEIAKRDSTLQEKNAELQGKDKKIAEQQAYIQKLLQTIQESKGDQSFASKFGGLFGKSQIHKTLQNDEHNETHRDDEPSEEPTQLSAQPTESEEKPDFVPTIIKIGDEHKFIQQEGIGGEVQRHPLTENDRFKPNESIFEQSQEAWQNFGYISLQAYAMPTTKDKMDSLNKSELNLILELMEENPMVKLCKDGIILYDKDGTIVGVTRVIEEVDRRGETGPEEKLLVSRYKLFANQLVLPIFALQPIKRLLNRGYRKNMKNYAGTYIDCFVAAEEQKESYNNKSLGISLQFDPMNDNTYHFQYENYYNDLEDTASMMSRILFTRDYDDYMRTQLGKIAKSRHRQLLQTGKLKPTSKEFIKPLILPEDPAEDGREL